MGNSAGCLSYSDIYIILLEIWDANEEKDLDIEIGAIMDDLWYKLKNDEIEEINCMVGDNMRQHIVDKMKGLINE